MTAEITIMNKSAVALAADSAVSVSTPSGHKVYNSANKLFQLSKTASVGVMVYGSAEYLGVPWETIIKDYRERTRGDFPHLLDHAQSFVGYLGSASHLFPEPKQLGQAQALLRAYFESLRERIDESVVQYIKANGSISERHMRTLAYRILEAELKLMLSYPYAIDVEPDYYAILSRFLRQLTSDSFDTVFQNWPMSERSKRILGRLAALLFMKEGPWPDVLISGVVIAGFGEDDYFPASYHFSPRALLNGRLLCCGLHRHEVSHSGATIQAYAQSEMVQTFMEGADPSYRAGVLAYVDALLVGYPQAILDALQLTGARRTALEQQLTAVAGQILSQFSDNLGKLSEQKFRNDVISTVSILPKDELAAMAESLVNLTSFKRRVTLVDETVGGPIDVAVISKGDGFVWIRRKHYFTPDLNPHFFQRYH